MPEAPVEGPLGSVDAGRPAVELVAWDIERLHSSAVLLPQVAELVTSEAPLSQLLASICQRAASVFGARRGSVFLIDDGRLVPRMSALADGARDSTSWPRFLSAREVPALVERVLQDGRPQLAPTSGSPLIAGWWADTFGIGSAMAVPIGPPAGVVGVLALDSEGAGAFGEDEVRRVSEAAAPLGAIIQWAQRAEGRQVEMVVAGAVRRLLEGGAAATTAMEAATAVARAIGTALGAE
ncbi:MAG: GAF domain-containing protein, partial [Acidimicrobiales bacterium]